MAAPDTKSSSAWNARATRSTISPRETHKLNSDWNEVASMDLITKSLLDDFRKVQVLPASMSDTDAFERFAGYCVVSDVHEDEFDIDDVHTGGGNDLGLDGIAIIVNGALVTSTEEVKDLIEINGSLDATFVFVQAKTGSSFNGGEIGTSFDGVDEFFAEKPTLPMNTSVANARIVMELIYKNSIRFRKTKPACRIYYVTTGEWTNDLYLTEKINKRIGQLKGLAQFADVTFTPLGADELHASYRRSQNSVTAEFQFDEKVLLPDIAGVTESYLGFIPASEFLKLITDDAGNIRKYLFTDNVRDYQGSNAVNGEISSTLNSDTGKGRFVVLNNGITIVTRSLLITRNKVTISDYQIVNGCQTSHVLFAERGSLTDSVNVPIKIVATTDEDVVTAIITATNRQTQVTAEDLYSLGEFQKKLESFLGAYGDKKELYYERRSKQYAASPGIEKVRIVTKSVQIRAFAAMFLDEPHKAGRYYKDLQALVGKSIFSDTHQLEPYYTAAFAHYRLEYLFRNNGIASYYKPARYHLLMAFRYIVGGGSLPNLSSNAVQKYCHKICEVLWNERDALAAFKKSRDAVELALTTGKSKMLTLDTVRTQAFRDSVLKSLGASK